MQHSKIIGAILFSSILGFACHRDTTDAALRGQDDQERRATHAGLVGSNTTTPSQSDYLIQEGTLPPMGGREDISLSRQTPPQNCPELNQRGMDATHIDPNCPKLGVERLNPVEPTPSETRSPTPPAP